MKFNWTFSIKRHGKKLFSKTLPGWLTPIIDIFPQTHERIFDVFASCRVFGYNPVTLAAAFLWNGIKEFWELANITPQKQVILSLCFLSACILSVAWPGFLWLLALIPVAFIQNMFFTLVSRSRNSQDTDYHRFCAWGSNGVWFICQVMIVKNIWGAINAGQWWYAILAGIVYSLATTEGSVLMMKRLIKSEKGKRRVGASDKINDIEVRLKRLETLEAEAFKRKEGFVMGLVGPPTGKTFDLKGEAPILNVNKEDAPEPECRESIRDRVSKLVNTPVEINPSRGMGDVTEKHKARE